MSHKEHESQQDRQERQELRDERRADTMPLEHPTPHYGPHDTTVHPKVNPETERPDMRPSQVPPPEPQRPAPAPPPPTPVKTPVQRIPEPSGPLQPPIQAPPPPATSPPKMPSIPPDPPAPKGPRPSPSAATVPYLVALVLGSILCTLIVAVFASILVASRADALPVCNPEILKAYRQDRAVLLTPCSPWTGTEVFKFDIIAFPFGHENESSFHSKINAAPGGAPGFYTVDLYKEYQWFPGINVLNYRAIAADDTPAVGNAIAFVEYFPPTPTPTETPLPQPTPTPRLVGTFKLNLTE